jgi:predicted Zn-dependent protease with MMP-like domain
MTPDHFEQLVAEALDGLPESLMPYLENVAVVIEPWPRYDQLQRVGLSPGALLLGLYEGIPRPRRPSSLNLVPPDKITIFQGPIELIHPGFGPERDARVREQVRRTVVHEVAHHFGFGEAKIRELGY